MSDDFGDFDEDDAFGTEPADPEQVARRLHEMRRREDLEDIDWDDLTPAQRGVLTTLMLVLLAWLKRQGAHP